MAATRKQKLLAGHEKDAATGCWNWTRTISEGGYGRVSRDRAPAYDLAHRAAHEEFVGAIPLGMCVCHKCDNRRCINPEHLFIGTRADNMRDMVEKDRQARGEQHGASKLTLTQVRSILADERKYRDIAADYGVTYGLIGHIKRRISWRFVPSL